MKIKLIILSLVIAGLLITRYAFFLSEKNALTQPTVTTSLDKSVIPFTHYTSQKIIHNNVLDSSSTFTSIKDNSRINSQCSQFCGRDLINSLTVGYELTDDEVQKIQSKPELFTEQLIQHPEILEQLLSSFFEDESTDHNIKKQGVAHAIFSSLSSQDRIALANQFAASEFDAERKIALKLLRSEIGNSESNLHGFFSILENESNPRILMQALNMSESITGLENKKQAINALSRRIETNYSNYLTGQAIIAMAKLDSSDLKAVNDHILSGIENYSNEIRSSALEAFTIFMDREINHFETGHHNKLYFLAAIEAIIHDPSAPPDIKHQAQKTLDRLL
ncbi:hypothetical protein [Sessilibacter corallicola]|uniref:hypothetical protein n=1 Tax=Sessilibacter corallicola TaxID=2904075 RepID=UPI001E4A377B|nr:hypothetical protein [Sessilibacter corallicola]MCE2030444.1 hypothetical protein [Sessilibacter corallicola]